MDNPRADALQVPGFNDIPVTYELPCESRFAHGFEEWVQVPAVTLKEFSMTAVINLITDKARWYDNVYDESIVARWKAEAFATFELMSEKAWDWCLAELRDKASKAREQLFVTVLNTGSCVCKSDDLLPNDFAMSLRAALQPLIIESTEGKDLVDPGAHPLIYGKTPVLTSGGATRLDERLSMASLYADDSSTNIAPEQENLQGNSFELDKQIRELGGRTGALRANVYFEEDPRDYYWLTSYQALPCEVSFSSSSDIRVGIETYINDLHPHHTKVYSHLEKIIAACIQPFNECLIKGGSNWTTTQSTHRSTRFNWLDQNQRGRYPLRMVTFGAAWEDSLPSWAIAFDDELENDLAAIEEELEDVRLTRGSLDAPVELYHRALQALQPIPQPDQATWEMAEAYLLLPDVGSHTPTEPPQDWRARPFQHLTRKALARVHPSQPEPGSAFSYEDWKQHRNVDKAIIEMDDRASCSPPATAIRSPTSSPYKIQLENSFAAQAAVATALYIFEANNVSGETHFRQETPMPGMIYRDDNKRAPRWVSEETTGQTRQLRYTDLDYGHAFKSIFGLSEDVYEPYTASDHLCMQETGHVAMPTGRLVAFPNVIESRVSASLQDETAKGAFGYVTIQLVDPHYRVCSTRNVPPQNKTWMFFVLRALLRRKGILNELAEEILSYIDEDDDVTDTITAMKAETKRLNAARYTIMPWDQWFDETV